MFNLRGAVGRAGTALEAEVGHPSTGLEGFRVLLGGSSTQRQTTLLGQGGNCKTSGRELQEHMELRNLLIHESAPKH